MAVTDLRRVLSAGIAAILIAVPAQGGGGAITGGATEWTQLLNNAQLAGISSLETQQLATLAETLTAEMRQLDTAISAYRNLVANTDILPDSVLGDIMGDIVRLQEIYGQAESIGRDAASLDAFLTSDAITDTLFQRDAYSTELLRARIGDWQTAWNGSMETSLRAAALSREDVASEGQLLETLQERMASATGRNEILQVATELSGAMNRQMLDLRQITTVQAEQTTLGWGRAIMEMDAEAAEEEAFHDQLRVEREIVDDIEGRPICEVLDIC